MGPKLSMLIGLLIGYVEAFDYLNRVELGANTAAIWESKSFFKSVQSWKGKINLKLSLLGFIATGGSFGGFILPMSQP